MKRRVFGVERLVGLDRRGNLIVRQVVSTLFLCYNLNIILIFNLFKSCARHELRDKKMKVFRYIIFIPIVFILVLATYTGISGLARLLVWIMSSNFPNLLWVKIVLGILFGLFFLTENKGSIGSVVFVSVVAFVFFAFNLLLYWLFGFGFWRAAIFTVILFFGWRLLKFLTAKFSLLTALISPNGKFSFWVILIVSILLAIFVSYLVWTNDIPIDLIALKAKVITLRVFLTIGIITLTRRLMKGAYEAINERQSL